MTDPQELRHLVEQERDRYAVVGLSVVVVRDRELVMAEGFGARDLGRDLPVTPATLFAIASDSKAFTAALCATFVDDGRLSWDAPVRDVLPWFRLYDARHRARQRAGPARSSHRRAAPRRRVAHRRSPPRRTSRSSVGCATWSRPRRFASGCSTRWG